MKGTRFIEELLQKMTLEEKSAELTQLWGEETDDKLMGIIYGYHKNPFLSDNAGSLLGLCGAEKARAVQAYHLEHSAHHIPFLFMTDVLNGFKTAFPSMLGMAAAWNPELAVSAASVAAREARCSGVHVTFSPMADLSRDARWGRVVEGFGEDPYLSSLYSAAFVRGYQKDDLSSEESVASCLKHFAGYGAVEGGRDYDSTVISDYSFYNEYLPPYRAAIAAGCALVMPSFTTLNGIPCSANPVLLQNLLRDELGFSGTVVSDCTAVMELIPHGVAADARDAARLSVTAGVDVEMVSTTYYEHLKELVASGEVPESRIDDAVRNVLLLKDRLGLFEDPFRGISKEREQKLHLCPTHRAAARKAAALSSVLLKNEKNCLPIRKTEQIALIGPYADSRKMLDIWALVNAEEKDCPTLREAFHDLSVTFSQGAVFHTLVPDITPEEEEQLLEDAVNAAASADRILLAIGEPPLLCGESKSRADITIPQEQIRLLQALHGTGKPVTAVIFAGRPLVLTDVLPLLDAALYVWFPGTEGANGIRDVLLGDVLPEGRLPMSFPRASGQVPIYYNRLPSGRPDPSFGPSDFKNGYADLPMNPYLPFGFGLTYTEFQYETPVLSGGGESVTVSCRVKNIGKRPGTETVQCYLHDDVGTCSRPVRELKRFQKVHLAPGESETVTFTLTEADLRYYIPGQGYKSEPGSFTLWVTENAASGVPVSFRLTGCGELRITEDHAR